MDDILEKDKDVRENPEGGLNPQFDYRFIEGLKKNRPDIYDRPLEIDSSYFDKLVSEGNYPDSAGHEFGIMGEPGMFRGIWREAPTESEREAARMLDPDYLGLRLTDEYAKRSANETYPRDPDEPLSHDSVEERIEKRWAYIKEHWDECIAKTSVDGNGDVNMTVLCNMPIESIDIPINLKKEDE